jgi:glycosyltransferase involved in cell wall biosynthesis
MRISVIMPVNLSPYESNGFKSASNPEDKFRRAVSSFLDQSFTDCELIIVSDGCDIAEEIYREEYWFYGWIRLLWLPKQEKFSGAVRQEGLKHANGEIICYLDHDDRFGTEHLAIIDKNFDTAKYDWVYYNDYLMKTELTCRERDVKPVQNSIGTSAIAHKRSIDLQWGSGYGHDGEMISKFLLPLPHTKIPTPGYFVCHCSGLNIDF